MEFYFLFQMFFLSLKFHCYLDHASHFVWNIRVICKWLMLGIYAKFFFIFYVSSVKGVNFTLVGTVSVLFSLGNFLTDIVTLETDEKKIRLFEAVDHSFKLLNLYCELILTGFCLRLQPARTGITGTKYFAWDFYCVIHFMESCDTWSTK